MTDIITADDVIYTAGRDGHYREFKFDDGQLVLLNSNRVCNAFCPNTCTGVYWLIVGYIEIKAKQH